MNYVMKKILPAPKLNAKAASWICSLKYN